MPESPAPRGAIHENSKGHVTARKAALPNRPDRQNLTARNQVAPCPPPPQIFGERRLRLPELPPAQLSPLSPLAVLAELAVLAVLAVQAGLVARAAPVPELPEPQPTKHLGLPAWRALLALPRLPGLLGPLGLPGPPLLPALLRLPAAQTLRVQPASPRQYALAAQTLEALRLDSRPSALGHAPLL